MWEIEEHHRVDKQLSGSVPIEVLKRYEKWKDIARVSGPPGLRAIKGFMTKLCLAIGKATALPGQGSSGG